MSQTGNPKNLKTQNIVISERWVYQSSVSFITYLQKNQRNNGFQPYWLCDHTAILTGGHQINVFGGVPGDQAYMPGHGHGLAVK